MPSLNILTLPLTARAALASGLTVALACGWIDPAYAQKKAIKWVVTCPAPRAGTQTEPVPAPANGEALAPDAAALATAAGSGVSPSHVAQESDPGAGAAPTSSPLAGTPPSITSTANPPPNDPATAVGRAAAPDAEAGGGRIQYLRPKPEPWVAAAGSTLQAELMRWAERAGWKVIYDTKTNYKIHGDIPFAGTFDQAAASFVRLYERAREPLVIDISVTQRLIHITNRTFP